MSATPHEPGAGTSSEVPFDDIAVLGHSDAVGVPTAEGADASAAAGPEPEPESAEAEAEEPLGCGQQVIRGIKEFVLVVGLALFFSFLIKTFLIQAFWIPSGSMEDTLVKDDRVIVTKLVPGPFDLQRGDIIVFEDPGPDGAKWLQGLPESRIKTLGGPFHGLLVFVGLLPEDSENHLIKRVIGLPGDHVQADGTEGKVKVNGVEIDESSYIKPGDFPSQGRPFDIVVPKDCVWVMGDHRSDSSDSRAHDDGTGKTGCVPMDKIVGRALVVVWPLDHVTWLGKPDKTFVNVPDPGTSPSPAPSSTKSATSTTPKPGTTVTPKVPAPTP